MDDFQSLLSRVRACRLCENEMTRPPRPVLQAGRGARILVAGQAPGNLAAQSGKPFDDPSGERLRAWMGVDAATFYDADRIAVVPMGFCFPGPDARGGDRPPMKRCAGHWRAALLSELVHLQVVILVGQYAQAWHLGARRKPSLTETVAAWRDFAGEGLFPTPHPSRRNNAWLKRHPWFERDYLPALRGAVAQALSSGP